MIHPTECEIQDAGPPRRQPHGTERPSVAYLDGNLDKLFYQQPKTRYYDLHMSSLEMVTFLLILVFILIVGQNCIGQIN
jgi:hypothetical protein